MFTFSVAILAQVAKMGKRPTSLAASSFGWGTLPAAVRPVSTANPVAGILLTAEEENGGPSSAAAFQGAAGSAEVHQGPRQ